MNHSLNHATPGNASYTLIVGGAGFVGANLAERLLAAGRRVLLFDNLGRRGVESNVRWLCAQYGGQLQVQIEDLRNGEALAAAVRYADAVFHLGAQVAVTTSLADPLYDFAVNAQGTLTLLEAIRQHAPTTPLFFTSTNKVYGDLVDLPLRRLATRYTPADELVRTQGIDERRNLAFHSPYGCSKGAADQYVLDYALTFGLRTVVFRMSCIYGPRQFGTEDQGWVAHFLRRALRQEALTIYGDGRQVRDLLYVGDLIDALLLAEQQIDQITGEAFNIGGGPANTVSLLELAPMLEALCGRPVTYHFANWRRGDQRYYVSNSAKFQAATGWQPQVGVADGLSRLAAWLQHSGGEDAVRQLSPRATAEPLPVTMNGGYHGATSRHGSTYPQAHVPTRQEQRYDN